MALDSETHVRSRVPFLGRIRITPMAVFWTLITFILVIPILLFLSVAVSPRLMSHGHQWFTLASFKPVFSGAYGLALLHSLILGVVAAVGAMAIALSMAWLVLSNGRTILPPGSWTTN